MRAHEAKTRALAMPYKNSDASQQKSRKCVFRPFLNRHHKKVIVSLFQTRPKHYESSETEYSDSTSFINRLTTTGFHNYFSIWFHVMTLGSKFWDTLGWVLIKRITKYYPIILPISTQNWWGLPCFKIGTSNSLKSFNADWRKGWRLRFLRKIHHPKSSCSTTTLT